MHSLVPESQCAWHAGISFWDGATNINDRSIGIELVNPGHLNGYRPFPAVQIEALLL
ncbi:MAG: N-acetylmuramoyl-L-alanine amidase [Alphaproteobacteria bacterium]